MNDKLPFNITREAKGSVLIERLDVILQIAKGIMSHYSEKQGKVDWLKPYVELLQKMIAAAKKDVQLAEQLF